MVKCIRRKIDINIRAQLQTHHHTKCCGIPHPLRLDIIRQFYPINIEVHFDFVWKIHL